MYKAELKKRSRSGKASLGWFLGQGYVVRVLKIRFECWCVTFNGKVIADCASKSLAQKIASAMNKNLGGDNV